MDISPRKAPQAGDLPLFEQAVVDQLLKVDEIGITGKAGKGLVWGVPVTSRAKRAYLPVMKACLGEEINEVPGWLTEIPDSKLTWE
jgi:hypothetical protein